MTSKLRPSDITVIEIPFGLEQNLLVFTGTDRDGKERVLTLDTCAWPHVVRSGLAHAAGWLTGEHQQAEGAGGTHETQAARIPALQLGTLKLQNLSALCDPLAGPIELDIMLGGPLLQDWVLKIDYPAGKLELHQPASWQATPDSEVFALSALEPGLPYLRDQLMIAGQTIPTALIDTGNNSALVLSAGLAESLNLKPERTVSGGGFGGAELSFGCLTLDSVSLGSLSWRAVQALILPPQASALLAQPDRALIGNALLRDCVLTLALSAGTCLLTRT